MPKAPLPQTPTRQSQRFQPTATPVKSINKKAIVECAWAGKRDPWLRTMHALHVGSRPDSLPCREEEYNKVPRCISELLEEGSGGCVCKSIFIYLQWDQLEYVSFGYFRSPRNREDCDSAYCHKRAQKNG